MDLFRVEWAKLLAFTALVIVLPVSAMMMVFPAPKTIGVIVASMALGWALPDVVAKSGRTTALFLGGLGVAGLVLILLF
jgi:hypothetical protein